MAIKIKLTGFEDLITQIQKADGNVNAATRQCMEVSAQIMQNELKAQMQASDENNDLGDLIARMPAPKIESNANRVSASVGYKKGAYNPKALSDGYKVVFLNYGTPRRTEHGKVMKRGFIQKAKKIATKRIKAEQEKTLNEILKGLQK